MTFSTPAPIVVAGQPAASSACPVVPAKGARRGVGIRDVSWSPQGFWGRRQRVNAQATIAHCESWMERLGWLENFDRVARGAETTERAGWQFSDSEVYKMLEGIAWELGRADDAELRARYEALVARVAAAQDDDGYLSTAFGHPGLPPRYSDMSMGHELYNVGHLLQAAVARLRTGHDDLLVAVARRAADHVCREFGPGSRESLCGHPEIEVGLAELSRATGEQRYLEQARIFLDRRGHGVLPVRPLLSAEYFQDDTPIREATAFRGHAVRALYLASGAVDVAVDSEDAELLGTLEAQWARTVERRTYLTGGMGSRHQDEGFGEDWELPPDRAYCETCAGVASTMLAWRLLLATGDPRYADLMERTLYNVVAAAPDEDGTAFFYANPLHVRVAGGEYSGGGVNHRAEGGVRAPWFDVSCCPTNVARTFASLHTYSAYAEGDVVSLVLYEAGEWNIAVDGGRLGFHVETRYPDDGTVRVVIDEAPPTGAGLRLRIPSWSRGAVAAGPRGEATPEPGWWDAGAVSVGDVVTLSLDVAPRLTWPDRRIDAMRGTVAVERGPLVLCLESTDLPEGASFEDASILASEPVLAEADGASVTLRLGDGTVASGGLPAYGSAPSVAATTTTAQVPLVPYHRWGERLPSQMRVMLPVAGQNS
ncbi:glycoside hydrolase family 127 protein [Demequina capsici]|uniref:Glycoside hydrolase family 127 protein n=1 Tax=Demequina capsici TaxID=3075620 RepID=A0AA96F6P5_9MICO|nr:MULTISPECIES: beta-L-arabinofuranosidase domain-containing protein [unclassified Demequina]WNM23740.1 glycoside hydrolase family 127 protein [Demequina sp. OYTSA14]WNM26579.1 glycoside hydrolase family 127 protein [Demequina sp. PMTSA13]